ncbi:uncharacterized protein [Aegilops tauschii subsp. strangulata]|uniref:aspartate--tRNA ligase n=1 Tax=Aegilops tauschii TaxID=37682 RepID=M8BH94_AEGTA|nr:aspartate--tRNA ligase, cytoplasmic-like [Triticum aestivum]
MARWRRGGALGGPRSHVGGRGEVKIQVVSSRQRSFGPIHTLPGILWRKGIYRRVEPNFLLICSSDQLLQHRYKTDFFILYEFPLAVRPFYTMPSGQESNPGSYSNSFDAYIRGQEVLSGSQRIHNKSLLIKRIDERGYIKAIFQQFTDTFGCGPPPRGGFGAGLERLVMLYLGVPDIRIASLFPRDPGRLVP